MEILFEGEYMLVNFYWCNHIADCYNAGMFENPFYVSCFPEYYPLALDLMLHGY